MQRISNFRSILSVLPLATLAPLIAVGSDAALQKCRVVDEAAARLKCYDAIPLASIPKAASVQAPNSAPATPTAVPVSNASSPVAPAASQFGLPAKAPDADINRIESAIVGKFEGWRANSNIRLANGQVWQIADDTSRFLDLDNPKVAIRRGALTSFYLEIEGTNHSPRVRRVK